MSMDPNHPNYWFRMGSLLYRLTQGSRPTNRDEINITMANGDCSDAARKARAIELQAMLNDLDSLDS